MSCPEVIRLGQAVVMHRRERPFVHEFVYRLFCMQLRIDRLDEVSAADSWLFGVNRRRVVSFMNADHGDRSGSNLMEWLEQTLALAGVKHPGGATWLQCFPRIFGYVFNPVSFWLLHDPQGQLRVILAEVNNTFGQRHQYVLSAVDDQRIESGHTLTCRKVFHVSPFCEVKGHYQFQYRGNINAVLTRRSRQSMAIDFFDDAAIVEPLLRTVMSVRPQAWRTRALLAALIRMPLMTFGVMARIHWHAFKLWRKGAAFHPVPPVAAQDVSTNVNNLSK